MSISCVILISVAVKDANVLNSCLVYADGSIMSQAN